jgi:hypothetical protein
MCVGTVEEDQVSESVSCHAEAEAQYQSHVKSQGCFRFYIQVDEAHSVMPRRGGSLIKVPCKSLKAVSVYSPASLMRRTAVDQQASNNTRADISTLSPKVPK